MKFTLFLTTLLLLVGCTRKSSNVVLNDWRDSLSCSELDLAIRLHVADSVYYHSPDSFEEDSIAYNLLTDDLFEKESASSTLVILNKATDGRAIMFTLRGLGTMCTGTTYIFYRKDDGTTFIKKVAGAKPCEEGGMVFPAQYNRVEIVPEGYALIGRFSFSSLSDIYEDTMIVSRNSLEEEQM